MQILIFSMLFSCTSPLRRTAARRREEIKECFTKVKQVFLLYLWDSLVTLELISLIPLAGSPKTDPLAVKLLDNRLYILKLQRQIHWRDHQKIWSKLWRMLQPGIAIWKKICHFVNYSCMNLWQISPKYSLRPRIEYLYFGWIYIFVCVGLAL